MAYQYYRTAYPGWGQSQLQFGAPPIPNIQPQPHWSAWDYYSAHAVNPDPSLFWSIMDRARQYRDSGGVGKHEARTWHRRIYSGLVPLTQVLPVDIGSAAAYEAYRGWRHHHHIMYSVLSGDIERERESLIGLAVAEASHLWQYSGRPMDAYGLREALESAALTASRIAYQVMEGGGDYMRAGRGSGINEGYDSDYSDPRYNRHRRHSSFGSMATAPGFAGGAGSAYGTPYTGAAPMPIPAGSSVGTGYGANFGVNSSPYLGGGALPQSYGGAPSIGGAYGSNPVIPGQPVGGFSTPYPGTTGSYVGSSPYMGAGSQYPQTAYGNTVVHGQTTIPGVPPGSTIIIQQQPRKHRRSSTSSGRHHHHHRSRSSDPMRKYGSSAVAYRV